MTNTPPVLIPDFQDFSELTYALDYLLYGWSVPSYLRPFINKVAVLAPHEKTPIADHEFAMMLGRSRNSMTHLRDRLDQWQKANNYAVVDLSKNKYNARHKMTEPTEYLFMLSDLLYEIVRGARASAFYYGDWKRAIRKEAHRLLNRVGTAPKWRERPARRARPADEELVTAWKRLRTDIDRVLYYSRIAGASLDSVPDQMRQVAKGRLEQMIVRAR